MSASCASEETKGYSMWSCFWRLWVPQRSWMLSAVLEAPPLEKGIIWSKCRFTVDPHVTHLPPSRFQTSCFTLVGMMRRWVDFLGTGIWKFSSPSTATNLNLKTFRPWDSSRRESTRWNTPLYDHMPFLIFSYTRTRSGGRLPALCSWAAL